MSYKINPCKACLDKYSDKDCNINTINDCVTETAAAFKGTLSNNTLSVGEAEENWRQCMNTLIKSEGKTPEDLRIEMAPVWNQVPHFFPDLLSELKNPEMAKLSCIDKCSSLRNNKKTCVQNCITDRNAVEMVTSSNMHMKKLNKEQLGENLPYILIGFVVLTLIVIMSLIFKNK